MIELRMLGRLTLTSANGREVQTLLGQPRRFALLAYLAAATPQGFHRRDSLLALFWPEFDQEHARAALRQALHVVRDALGADAVASRGDEEIGLDFDQVSCDVAAFNRAVDGEQLREALDLYRGNLLEGFFISDAPEFERWLETERARLQERASRAARDFAAHCEERGKLTTAVHWARRAAQLAPHNEGLLRRLITVLDRHGDRAGAVQVYEEFAARLVADYEAEPTAQTRALVAAVRARQRAAVSVPLLPMDLLARLRPGLADRYRVERELARGRTAAVFLAHDLKHDRPVAIKVLHPELAAAVGAERFLREIEFAARLRHPHIVALHDSGETDGLLYFVMPYVAGESLRARLDREPQLPITEAVRIMGDVAQALGYAYGLGVVHRDIKPENILLEDGHALVADFGIARAITAAGSERLTETGIALGTPAYMSPEQGAEDGQVDGRSDLYALGCVAYEMLAGTPPFTGPTAQAILARHAVDPVAPIRTVRETVPPGVERAVLRALAKVPADRYPGATAFAQALTEPAFEPGPSGRLSKSRGGKLALSAGLSAAAALTLLVGFGVEGWRERLHPGTPPTSNAEAYDLYVRADVLLTQRQNRENDSVAIMLFERAVALDPSFAAAQAGLARAYALRVGEFAPGDTAALQRAQVAAEKALRLNPNLADAHQAQARLLWGSSNHFFHERAAQEDRRALSLNPNMARAHQHLGNIYLHIGLLDDAITELQKALAISPREDGALRRIAEVRAYQGQYKEALEILKQVDPDASLPFWTYQMALVLLHLGRNDEAFALVQGYLKAHPEDRGGVVTSARAVWFAIAGNGPAAERDIRTAVRKGQGYIHFHHAAYHIALAYALLHQPDSAVQWLRRVADGGMPCYPLFASDPFLNKIRADRGFVAFIREQKTQWERWRTTL
jgi:serine/threonine protein kinase/DNA-binding SARP family transcriptional activator/tetratricopeptide (TPR) repeat protein